MQSAHVFSPRGSLRASGSAAVIELVSDSDTELRAGDRGVVREIEASGAVVVEWERGFDRAIDPRHSAFRALPAA